MPKYHFNVHDGVSIPDIEGHEMTSLQAAQEAAIQLSGHLIRELGPDFWEGEEWKMEVTDDRGLILFQLMFVATSSPATLI